MSALIEAFQNGGLWMYIIVVWGGAFYGEDHAWKQDVWDRTHAVVRQALDGLT